jgi:hypothetical protein
MSLHTQRAIIAEGPSRVRIDSDVEIPQPGDNEVLVKDFPPSPNHKLDPLHSIPVGSWGRQDLRWFLKNHTH